MAVLTRVWVWVVVLLVAAGCRTGPEQWGPFRGQVVDAETGQPIEGAHVMVLWARERPALLHLSYTFYDAEETTTNADGSFQIPRRTRFMTAFVTEPAFSVFAPGYVMLPARATVSQGRPYVDPTVVPMRPLRSREERCQYEPLGVMGDAQRRVPRYVEAQRNYQQSLQCGAVR